MLAVHISQFLVIIFLWSLNITMQYCGGRPHILKAWRNDEHNELKIKFIVRYSWVYKLLQSSFKEDENVAICSLTFACMLTESGRSVFELLFLFFSRMLRIRPHTSLGRVLPARLMHKVYAVKTIQIDYYHFIATKIK